MKEMGVPDVRIDTRLNKAVWAEGISNVPYHELPFKMTDIYSKYTEQEEGLSELPSILTSPETEYINSSLGKEQLIWESGRLAAARHSSSIRNTMGLHLPASLKAPIKSNSCPLFL
ncbi:hypothetical protein H8959_003591 [Pygathrix nigripes]